jgi:hypothetical protein
MGNYQILSKCRIHIIPVLSTHHRVFETAWEEHLDFSSIILLMEVYYEFAREDTRIIFILRRERR